MFLLVFQEIHVYLADPLGNRPNRQFSEKLYNCIDFLTFLTFTIANPLGNRRICNSLENTRITKKTMQLHWFFLHFFTFTIANPIGNRRIYNS